MGIWRRLHLFNVIFSRISQSLRDDLHALAYPEEGELGEWVRTPIEFSEFFELCVCKIYRPKFNLLYVLS